MNDIAAQNAYQPAASSPLESLPVSVINFYVFVDLEAASGDDARKDLESIRADHLGECKRLGLRGTILLAHEGINVGLSGAPDDLRTYIDFFVADQRFAESTTQGANGRHPAPQAPLVKWTHGVSSPYRKLECRIKPAIVTFARSADPKPDAINTAPRLTPDAVQRLLDSAPEDLVIVDTRNDYEADWGTFEGAVTLPIKKFSDFPAAFEEKFGDARDKHFLFFCTGGIRCEKAVPWAIERGFRNATQIDGGIIHYLERFGAARTSNSSTSDETPAKNHFRGSCFVFDQRWALGEDLDEKSATALVADPIQPRPTNIGSQFKAFPQN